ncbi:MAG TPA: cellulose synthase operon protein YhjQ/BcsQ [Verrucomicrobiae bacterium]|nr:cellulose synthase operon protein YhjQ/BcsQ [Verrucomicrobiae bacterium]
MENRDPKIRAGGNAPTAGVQTGDKRQSNQKSQASITLADVYFVLFRRKWLILGLSAAGFVAALVLFFKRPTLYTSEATVMVKREVDNGFVPLSQGDGSQQVTSVVGGPEGLLNSEVAILESFDLGLRVASNVPPQKILSAYGGGTNLVAAASVVHDSLTSERMPRSSVIRIALTMRDQNNVQSLLNDVINAYQQLHDEIHMKSDAWDQLKIQASGLHNQLIDKQTQLQGKLKLVGVTDVDEARKTAADMASQIHLTILNTQEELAFSKEKLAKLKGTTKPEDAAPQTNAASAETDIPKEKVDHYNQVTKLLSELKDQYVKLRSTYSDQSEAAREKQAQIDKAMNEKLALEKDEPRLVFQKTSSVEGQAETSGSGDVIHKEEAQIAGLELKLKKLQASAAEVNTSITNLDAVAGDVHDLKLNIHLLEQEWQNAETAAENASLEANMQGLNNANISVVEHPTPPARELSKTPKIMGVAAAAGVLGGIALAFLLELYVDHTVKRPKEIEGDLGMRLFLSIPDIHRNGHAKAWRIFNRKALPEPEHNGNGHGSPAPGANGNGNGKSELALWDKRHSLHQYNEALRDRLLSYFDVNNMTHKPKLVAVTGAANGAGTSTIASGLAASLSETGDGNVLLVDMNLEHGEAQQFHMGKPACELDAALATETRNNALIQDKLYVVSGRTNGGNLSRMLPKAFASLMPKLQASDYDYIIFDMPPIGRTGLTQRLASFMDMMLLVVEAEKTSRVIVKQAGAVLAESKASVSVVLNKTRRYVPASLHPEF